MKHKDKHQLWARLGKKTGASSASAIKSPPVVRPKVAIKIIELPGFRDLEDKMLIYSSARDPFPHLVVDHAKELSLATFGTKPSDMQLQPPPEYWDWPDYSVERRQFDEASEEHDEQFETLYLSDDEAVDYLLTLGVDFRDENDKPLKCMSLFAVQAEAAAKGLAGKLPDLGEVSEKRWQAKIEAEAKAFIAKKNKSRPGSL